MVSMQQSALIHIVDDDESFQLAMKRLLSAAGYNIRCYSSAGDFLLSGIDDEPGCILLDVRMPGPNGLDLQKALADQKRSPKSLYYTYHQNLYFKMS